MWPRACKPGIVSTQTRVGVFSRAVGSLDTMRTVSLDDYKVVLYRNEPSGWVAEVPSIPGCHALMPTREAALAELAAVFQMISDEYAERNKVLPADTTEILHA